MKLSFVTALLPFFGAVKSTLGAATTTTTTSVNIIATFDSVEHLPDVAATELCLQKTFDDAFDFDGKAWVMKEASVVSESPTMTKDHTDMLVDAGRLLRGVVKQVGDIRSPLSQTPSGSGGACKLCPPDDDFEMEEVFTMRFQGFVHSTVSQAGSGNDDSASWVGNCEFCALTGEVDVAKLSSKDLALLSAHRDWEKEFCACLREKDPEAIAMGCATGFVVN